MPWPWVKPKPKEYKITGNSLMYEFYRLGFTDVLLNDNSYWYVGVQDWITILSKTRASMPSYLVDRFDCDKYAFITAARVVLESFLNTCAVCIGDSPFGYHSWNIVMTPVGLYYFEPQNGNFWLVQGWTAPYKPDRIITI